MAIATLLITLGSSARAEGFVRPSLFYVWPTMSGASSAAGVGFAAGSRFGPQIEHELSFEGDWVKWDESASYSGQHVSGSLTSVPCLLNYRYYFGKAASTGRFYVGPSAGFARTTAAVSAIGSDTRVSASDSSWSAAFGASAGLVFRLAEKVELDVGYRYLVVRGSHVTLSDVTVSLDDARASILYAGISFKF